MSPEATKSQPSEFSHRLDWTGLRNCCCLNPRGECYHPVATARGSVVSGPEAAKSQSSEFLHKLEKDWCIDREYSMKPEQDAFSKFEHEGWQRVATKYEQAWSGLTRGFIPALLDAAEIADPVQLLDVACGPGYVAEAALARGAQPTGLDFSAEMVRLAKYRCPQIDFREGDAQALPFPDNSFDRVVMNFGLLHLANPPAAFSESFRVLRSGGRYAFTVWAGPELSPGAKLVDDAVKAHANMNVSLPQGPDCFAYGNRQDSSNALAAVGFLADSVSFETVTVAWKVPSPSFIFESERSAGVRTAALLAKQTPEALGAIQAHIEDAVRRYAEGDRFSLPYAAHVVAVEKR